MGAQNRCCCGPLTHYLPSPRRRPWVQMWAMMSLILSMALMAGTAEAPKAPPQGRVTAQATARIISPARINFPDGSDSKSVTADGPVVSRATQERAGAPTLNLVEFH